MKITVALLSFIFIGLISLNAQNDKQRKSPLKTVEADISGKKINIQYGSPSVKGRVIFGDLVPYGKIWRTGANEATVFETSGDLMINGKKLVAGKYALFTVPGEKEWELVFNSRWDQWGAYKYKNNEDVLRVNAPVTSTNESVEMFTISIVDGNLVLAWDKTTVSVALK